MAALMLLRLTLRGVLSDIPHDLSAFITYVLLLAFVGFIVIGGRGSSTPPPPLGRSEKSPEDSEP